MKSDNLLLFLAIALLIGGGGYAVYEMTRGLRNNNPGNIVYDLNNDWLGQTGDDGEYVTFSNPVYGLRAIGKTLLSYSARGLNTIDSIIREWSKTDQDAYVANMSKWLGVDPHTPIDVETFLPQFMAGITRQENAVQPYSAAQISQAVQLAVGNG